MSLDQVLAFLHAHVDAVAFVVLAILGYWGLGKYLQNKELQEDVQTILAGAYAMVAKYRRQNPEDDHDWLEKGLKYADDLWRALGKARPPSFDVKALAEWTHRREMEKASLPATQSTPAVPAFSQEMLDSLALAIHARLKAAQPQSPGIGVPKPPSPAA